MVASPAGAEPGLPWHPALAYAITGTRMDDLGRQTRPDPARLATMIIDRTPGGRDGLLQLVRDRRRHDQPWPYPIPAELTEGLGAAQRLAALAELVRLLGVEEAPSRTVTDRPLSADDRRLLNEVPPHHGH